MSSLNSTLPAASYIDIGVLLEMSKVNTLHKNLLDFVGHERIIILIVLALFISSKFWQILMQSVDIAYFL